MDAIVGLALLSMTCCLNSDPLFRREGFFYYTKQLLVGGYLKWLLVLHLHKSHLVTLIIKNIQKLLNQKLIFYKQVCVGFYGLPGREEDI